MVFWFWVIFLAILFLGFDGILTMIGLIVGLIILFIVVMSFKEYFQDHPDKKKKFQKSLIWMLIIAVITLVAQLVISNVIYNRYHVVYILNKEVSRPNSDYVAGYIEEYEETFLARNDSSAIAKI